MKNILSLFVFSFLFFGSAFAQNTEQQVELSDPQAQKIFENVRAKYDEYQSMKVEVSIEIEVPEQPVIKQKGVLIQKQENYQLELEDQLHICNGKELWLYLKEKNEVQIHEVGDGDDALLTPKDLLKFYERTDYISALTNEYSKKNRTVQQIEMKPAERGGDILKFRVEIYKKTSEIVSIKAFFADGVRYNVYVDKLTPSPEVLPDFVFNPKKYPGVNVEDLRID